MGLSYNITSPGNSYLLPAPRGAAHRRAHMESPLASELPTERRHPRPLALSNWLFGIAFLVFAMVVIGGITRLTESGLSITEWRPITGAIPPLSEADWEAEFARYQATPEYQQIN